MTSPLNINTTLTTDAHTETVRHGQAAARNVLIRQRNYREKQKTTRHIRRNVNVKNITGISREVTCS